MTIYKLIDKAQAIQYLETTHNFTKYSLNKAADNIEGRLRQKGIYTTPQIAMLTAESEGATQYMMINSKNTQFQNTKWIAQTKPFDPTHPFDIECLYNNNRCAIEVKTMNKSKTIHMSNNEIAYARQNKEQYLIALWKPKTWHKGKQSVTFYNPTDFEDANKIRLI